MWTCACLRVHSACPLRKPGNSAVPKLHSNRQSQCCWPWDNSHCAAWQKQQEESSLRFVMFLPTVHHLNTVTRSREQAELEGMASRARLLACYLQTCSDHEGKRMSEDSLKTWVLHFNHVGSRDRTQIVWQQDFALWAISLLHVRSLAQQEWSTQYALFIVIERIYKSRYLTSRNMYYARRWVAFKEECGGNS